MLPERGAPPRLVNRIDNVASDRDSGRSRKVRDSSLSDLGSSVDFGLPSGAADCPGTGPRAKTPRPYSSKRSSKRSATPAPSTTPPDGLMSGPPGGAGVTIGENSRTSAAMTSGSGPPPARLGAKPQSLASVAFHGPNESFRNGNGPVGPCWARRSEDVTAQMRRNPSPWRTEHTTGRSAPRPDGTLHVMQAIL